jgi:hypothetical protein|tara:strand:- start:2382 stop:2495 length:114 start_codon:yes stop_codon:yes gene_type:complete
MSDVFSLLPQAVTARGNRNMAAIIALDLLITYPSMPN